MTEVVGHIAAQLDIETAAFKRDLDEARKNLDSNAAAMNKSLASMEKQFGAVNDFVKAYIGLELAKAFGRDVKAALDFAGSLKETAEQAGLTTTAYQSLIYMAEQTGGSEEKLTRGLANFNRVIGEAAQGSDKAVESLRRVGISVGDLQKMSVEQLFDRASDSISRMAGASNRAELQQDLFGKSARVAGASFSQSAKSLEDFNKQALAAGVILAESTIESAHKAEQQFNTLSKVIKVELTEAFVQWSPLLIKTAKFVADLGEITGDALRKFGLLKAATTSTEYDDLLKKRLEITDALNREQAKPTFFGLLDGAKKSAIAELQGQLEAVDKRLTDIRVKLADEKKEESKAGAGKTGPAVTGEIMETERAKKAREDYQKMLEAGRKAQIEGDAEDMARAEEHAAQLRKIGAGQLELEAEQYRVRKGMVAEMYAFEIGTLEERQKIEQAMELDHQAALGDIFAQAEQKKREVAQMNWQGQLQYAGSALGSISALMQTHSKTAFEIGKKAAIAQATIAAITSAIEAYKSASAIPFVGWILGPIAAAAALVVGMANVQKIKSTSFDSGGAASGSFGGSAISVPNGDAVANGASASQQQAQPPAVTQPKRSVTFILKGEGAPSDEYMRSTLIPAFNSAAADGTQVLVR
jgi:hypothetical protein